MKEALRVEAIISSHHRILKEIGQDLPGEVEGGPEEASRLLAVQTNPETV